MSEKAQIGQTFVDAETSGASEGRRTETKDVLRSIPDEGRMRKDFVPVIEIKRGRSDELQIPSVQRGMFLNNCFPVPSIAASQSTSESQALEATAVLPGKERFKDV